MGLLRIMMPPKLQLLAVVAFAVAMLFLENQIQKLEESRAKLGGRPGGRDPGTATSRRQRGELGVTTGCSRARRLRPRGCPAGPPRGPGPPREDADALPLVSPAAGGDGIRARAGSRGEVRRGRRAEVDGGPGDAGERAQAAPCKRERVACLS
ncbi:heparan sulfate 2-O-sulfotransferase 1 [Cricetulus griseus]